MTATGPRSVSLRPSGDDVIIEATDVVKTYDTGRVQVHALRGVSHAVQPGEMVAIMAAARPPSSTA